MFIAHCLPSRLPGDWTMTNHRLAPGKSREKLCKAMTRNADGTPSIIGAYLIYQEQNKHGSMLEKWDRRVFTRSPFENAQTAFYAGKPRKEV
jgi:hypothetical protein